MVEQYTGHPLLVDFASKLIKIADIGARDETKLSRAFQRFSQNKVKFFREYPERWQSPLRTIVWGIGDCDDKAILIGSLTRCFRIPTRMKFLRLKLPDGKNVSHVYPQVRLNGSKKWVSLESVRPVALGFDYEAAARGKGVPCTVEYIGDS